MYRFTPSSLIASCLLLWVFRQWLKATALSRRMSGIPAIGPTGAFTSYWTALRYAFNARAVIAEGYSKYPNGVFRVAKLRSWVVVVTSPDLISQMAKASEAELSFYSATEDVISARHTLGSQITTDPYHAEILTTLLTRNYKEGLEDMQDEMQHALAENIPSVKDSQAWTKVTMLPVALQVVCRTINRLFVGLPVCRDKDFVDLNIQFTVEVFKTGMLLTLLPESLKPFATRFLSNVPRNLLRGLRHLGTLVEEAMSKEETFGKDWADRPNNMIYWLLTGATHGKRREVSEITNRILAINFAAIHTTSSTLTDAIYDLAVRPELLAPLREEADSVLSHDGWTKESLGKLHKMDSFLKESLRLSMVAPLQMTRVVKSDFRFNNGLFVPQGVTIAAPYDSHVDTGIYSQGGKMDAFRWSDVTDVDPSATSESAGSSSSSWRIFGHGRHACPGRFFAISMLKMMLAHIVVHYDFKMAEGGRPAPLVILDFAYPDPKAQVLFKLRTD